MSVKIQEFETEAWIISGEVWRAFLSAEPLCIIPYVARDTTAERNSDAESNVSDFVYKNHDKKVGKKQ